MFKRIVLILITITLIAMGGCSKKESSVNSNMVSSTPGTDYTSNEAKESENNNQTDQNTILQNKKIIQNYQVNIDVDDIKKAAKEIENKTKEFGGFIEMEELIEYNCNSSIRIPSSKVDLFVEYLEKNFNVTNKNKSIEDITDAYTDNDARLKNLRAEESQVLEILKRANTIDEILKVQTELYRIRGEIEILETNKKNWDRQVDYSTVKLNIIKRQIVSDNKIKILNSNEFFKSIWKGFNNTSTYLILAIQKIIIFLISNLIPLTIIVGIGYVIYRVNKKNNK